MANGPTEKQFQDLIEEQKTTNRLLMSSEELAAEYGAVDESQNEDTTKEQEKTNSLLTRMVRAILGTGGSKKKEEDEKKGAGEKKRGKLLGSMAKGITGMHKNMKDFAKAKVKGIMALLKGTLIAGLLIALIAFLNSQTWQDMKEKIADELVPKMINFYNNTLKPFAAGILKFIKDPSWTTFTDIFGGLEDPKSLAFAIAGIAVLLKPSLITSAFKLGIGTMKVAFNALGPIATTMGSTLSTLGSSISTNVITPIGNAVSKFGEAVWTTITEIGTKITNLGTALKTKLITPITNAVTNMAKEVWTTMIEMGTKIKNLGIALKARFITPITNAVTNIAVDAWTTMMEMGTKIKNLGIALKARLITPITNAATQIAKDAWVSMVGIGTKIKNLGLVLKANLITPVTNAATQIAKQAWTSMVGIGTTIKNLGIALNANLAVPMKNAALAAGAKVWTAIKLIPAAILALQSFFVVTLGPMLAAALVPLAPFIAVAAVVVAAAVAIGVTLYALYQAFEDFRYTLEETGSIGEALKVGISKFMGTILGFIPNLILKLVGWVAGLFGFDEFKEKVQNIDVIQFISDKIKAVFDGIQGWIADLFTFDEGLAGTAAGIINIAAFLPNMVADGLISIGAWLLKLFGFSEASESVKEWKDWSIGSIVVGAIKSIVEWFSDLFDIDWKKLAGDLVPDWLKGWFGGGDEDLTPAEIEAKAAKSAKAKKEGEELDVGPMGQHGRPLMAGQTYMINERGQEFFKPSHSGHLMNAQRTSAMMNSALQRRMDGMGGGGGSAIIAPTTVANTQSTNITHTTTSIVNPDLVVSTINKAA